MNKNIVFLLLAVFLTITLQAQKNNRTIPKNELSVYVFFSTSCPICQYYTKEINELFDTLVPLGIKIKIFFPKTFETSEIESFIKDYNLKAPCFIDRKNQLIRQYHITTTPQIILLKGKKAIYSGAISDAYISVGKRRQISNVNYIRNALIETLNNQRVQTPKTIPIGCSVQ